jgi:hypothetical protein
MTPSLTETEASTLSLAAHAYSQLHGLAYARLAEDLTIVEASPNFRRLSEGAVAGRSLMDVLPEFIGLEAAITEVQQRRSPEVRLERVNRAQADGSIGYFDFYFVPLLTDWLVIVEDVTRLGQLEQRVQQAHHELRLLHSEIERLHAELRGLNNRPPGEWR